MICSLCLKEIKKLEASIEVDGRIRHETCSNELEKMVDELEKIYEDTCQSDI